MYCVSLHLDGFGCGGAEILAGSATYAECLLDLGIHTPIDSSLKTDSISRTMLGTVAALHTITSHNAPPTMKNCVTQLRHTLLLERKREDCPRRADLTTEGAVVKAITLIISHHGLHNTLQAILHNSRLQDVRGALAYAQMARRALRLQMLYALRTRRCYGARATMFTTALHCSFHTLMALLRLGNGDSGHSRNGSDKVSARVVGRLFFRCFASHCKGYSTL
jgi:hypothetical protein